MPSVRVVVVVEPPVQQQNAQGSLGSRSGKPKRPAGRRNYRLQPPFLVPWYKCFAQRWSRGPAAVDGRTREMTSKQRSAARKRMGRKTAEAVLIGAARGRDGRVACLVRREGNQNAPALSPISILPRPASFSEPPPLYVPRWEWEWEWHQPLPRPRPSFIALLSSFVLHISKQ